MLDLLNVLVRASKVPYGHLHAHLQRCVCVCKALETYVSISNVFLRYA